MRLKRKTHKFKLGAKVEVIAPFYDCYAQLKTVVRRDLDIDGSPLYVLGNISDIGKPKIIQDIECITDVKECDLIGGWEFMVVKAFLFLVRYKILLFIVALLFLALSLLIKSYLIKLF